MFIHEPFVFVSDDHCEMHGFACRPAVGMPQAILLCIHGMMEHSGRYDEFALSMLLICEDMARRETTRKREASLPIKVETTGLYRM